MANIDKRLARIRNNRRDVRFEELRSVMEAMGFSARPGKGDHWIFDHPLLSYVVTIDPRRPAILPIYVKKALNAIDEVQDLMERGGS